MAPSGLLLWLPEVLDGGTIASRSPGQLGQSAAQVGSTRPRANGHAPTTVDSLRVLACARSGAAAPGRVMPGQPQVASVLRVLLCDRGQAGAGLIEPGLAALGQGLAALPQR